MNHYHNSRVIKVSKLHFDFKGNGIEDIKKMVTKQVIERSPLLSHLERWETKGSLQSWVDFGGKRAYPVERNSVKIRKEKLILWGILDFLILKKKISKYLT